jgi:hypothetical protein
MYRGQSAVPQRRPFEMYRDLSVKPTLADSVNDPRSPSKGPEKSVGTKLRNSLL